MKHDASIVRKKSAIIVFSALLCIFILQGCKTNAPEAKTDLFNADLQKAAVEKSGTQKPSPGDPLANEVKNKYDDILKKILESEKKQQTPPEEVKPELYRMKIGDSFEISVLDENEMTRQVKVIPDGTITYLLVGEIQAENKTVPELRNDIENKLKQYFVNPKVSILLNETIVQPKPEDERVVSVIGAVKNPGEFKIKKNSKIVDIVAQSGGLLYINDWMGGRTVANLKASYISRKGVKLDVDFDKLLRLGDMDYNILLDSGDFIYIADAENSSIFILGEVTTPQIIPYNRDITLVEALSRSGGFTNKAEKSRVIVLRNSTLGNEFVYVNVEALLYGDHEEQNMILKEGDIIYVPEQGMSEYSRYAEYLMVFGQLLLQGYQIRDQVMFPRLKR